MPEVSILLPIYRMVPYLRESLVSVLDQDFRDYEIIVLDNSKDRECESLFLPFRDPRIRYIWTHENIGLFEKLNRGAGLARSPWLRLWSDDDRMLPGSLGAFMRFAGLHPEVGFAYCDFFDIESGGARTGAEALYSAQRIRTPEIAGRELSALLFWCYGCLPGNISTVLLRKEAWEKTGRFLTGFQQAPDMDLWVRISEKFPVGFLDEKLIELRRHKGQLGRSREKFKTVADEEIPIILKLKESLSRRIPERDLMACWLRQRGCQHAHWMISSIIRGDFSGAEGMWRAIRAMGRPWSQLLVWLLSVNGRYWGAKDYPDRLFDSCAAALGGSTGIQGGN